jgi:hypothetical protein
MYNVQAERDLLWGAGTRFELGSVEQLADDILFELTVAPCLSNFASLSRLSRTLV